MAQFQGIFFLILGLGLLGVAYQSLARGWLPFGSNGFKGRLEWRRDEQPGLFWLAWALYATAGPGDGRVRPGPAAGREHAAAVALKGAVLRQLAVYYLRDSIHDEAA